MQAMSTLMPKPRAPEPAAFHKRPGGRPWRQPLALAVALALTVPAAGAQSAAPGLRATPEARIFARWATPGNGASASAQVRVVSTCADAGSGSLRDTLASANAGDTIDLSILGCSVIALSSGALLVPADNILLQGPGAAHLAIDGGGLDRVLIDPHDALGINGLTIRNGANRTTGFHVAGGGCIAAAGALSLVDSVVTGCLAAGEGAYGGALYAYQLSMQGSTVSDSSAYGVLPGTGTAANGGAGFVYRVDLVDSTISGNSASHYPDPPRSFYDVGGGLMVVRGGRIDTSTFSGNRSGERGGAINSLNDLAISNSTLANNLASRGRGGAVYMRAPGRLALANVTISGNRAAEGGGVHLNVAGAQIDSSIIAGNHADAVSGTDALSATTTTLVDGSHNLIGAGRGSVAVPADSLSGDPQLGPLGDNGGPTLTMAPWLGSPVIDAGSNPLAATFDQRGPGHPRLKGAAPDIGAVEGARIPSVPVPALSGPMAAWLAALLAGLAAFIRRWRNGVTITP